MDVAIDLRKDGNINDSKRILVRNAEKNNCSAYYGNYEISGRRRAITRNHYVLTFTFPKNEQNIIKFIHFVKKETSARIEMIAFEQGKYELLYASRKYMTLMEGEMVKKYIKTKHDLLYGEYKNIVNEVRK